MISIEEYLFQNAQKFPDKVALISEQTQVTYGQLWERSLKAASVLQSRLNLVCGGRVIVAASATIEFVYAYFGIHLSGGICVPIDPNTNQTRFNYIFESTSPTAVLGQLHKIEQQTLPLEIVSEEASAISYKAPDMENVADILFTTGTTGAPKGVALSYTNIAAAARNINAFIGNTESDIEILALPVSHSFGLGRLKCTLVKGGSMVMLGTFANVKRFFDLIKRWNVSGFGMVPSSWSFIKKMSGKYLGKFSEQLKYIEIGSSFMPVEEKQLLMELLPSTRICMHYGSTEASRSAFMEFHECKNNLLTAGKASPYCSIKVFSPEGKELPYGSQGEICVKGEHVTCSYWNESVERFQSDFYGDYFRTGDGGTQDENGYIYLKSRLKEIINVGGKKVSPIEVEQILNTVPGIYESACVGVSDPNGMLGEVVKAFIVADEGVTDQQILDCVRPKLELYKLPVLFERIAEIPKTSSGKIQRLSLKK
ncbi:MAG: acyl--CoA ligase [Bacteroidales bacterium]|nr:acyl--CoA ligase [Bacteroidales bacterium]